MLDMYDFNNDIWLCHSFNGNCFNVTAFVSPSSTLIWSHSFLLLIESLVVFIYFFILFLQQPAINVLREIQVFLEGNPTEIVSIFIEDYVSSPRGLSKVFNTSGVSQYLFPLSRMPKNGEDWPTVDDMVQKNQRLVVFTSKSSKEASEGLAYEWNYVVENQCESFYSLTLCTWW